MSPLDNTIAICLYGTDTTNLEKVREGCVAKLSRVNFRVYNLKFFEDFSSDDLYKNMWKSCMKKRTEELEIGYDFPICIAINASDENTFRLIDTLPTKKLFQPSKIKISDFSTLMKLFYITGEKNLTTLPDINIFYADSLIFDRVCEFGINRDLLHDPSILHDKDIELKFFHYLKSLKIKIECINYEDSSLFKRTT